VRISGIVGLLVVAAGVETSCVTQPNDQQYLDATLDQSAPFCTTSKDCANGLACSYEVLVGCGAKGECRDFGAEAGSGTCTAATTACGCDGKLVEIPACWMDFAPAPVHPSGATTCRDASGG
jgi:hypothetical protein